MGRLEPAKQDCRRYRETLSSVTMSYKNARPVHSDESGYVTIVSLVALQAPQATFALLYHGYWVCQVVLAPFTVQWYNQPYRPHSSKDRATAFYKGGPCGGNAASVSSQTRGSLQRKETIVEFPVTVWAERN